MFQKFTKYVKLTVHRFLLFITAYFKSFNDFINKLFYGLCNNRKNNSIHTAI